MNKKDWIFAEMNISFSFFLLFNLILCIAFLIGFIISFFRSDIKLMFTCFAIYLAFLALSYLISWALAKLKFIRQIEENALLKTLQRDLPKKLDRNTYKVVLVDQFHGHCEEGYTDWGVFNTLQEAVRIAKVITEQGIKECGSIKKWDGMGDAGLVYDWTGRLVWDGVKQYRR